MYQNACFILSGWDCDKVEFSYDCSRPSGPLEAFLACLGYLAQLCERNDEELKRLGVPRVELSHEVYRRFRGVQRRDIFVVGDPHRTAAGFRQLVDDLTLVPRDDVAEFWRRLEMIEQCVVFKQAGP